MSRLASLVCLALALAACSKQEPPLPVVTAPAKPVIAAPPVAQPAPAPQPEPALLAQGEMIFKRDCATCHMADGSGVPYLQPAIKGSAWISASDPQLLLSLVLRGSALLGEAAKAYDNDMAPQDHLTDTEIAALATYVRQRFASPPITEPVTPAQVAIARARPGLPQ
jgi:mono/diheme cytochrome c family protein